MKRLIGFTAALCLLAIMAGCGGVNSTGTLAYISNSTGTGFTVYNINTDGTLTRSSISPLNTPEPPQVLQFSPNGKWAYFLDTSGSNIYAYTRAGNGTLAIQIDVIPVGPGASSLVVSSNSNFVYVSLPATKMIATFSIDQSTGDLTQVGSNALLGVDIIQLALSPNGSVLFGLSQKGQAVLSFTLTASTGVATLTNTYPVGNTPEHLIISPNGLYAYVIDSASVYTVPASGKTTPNIFGFTIGTAGALTPMPDSPFQENADASGNYPNTPKGGAVSSDNRYLFVANNGTDNISAYQISSTTGELSEVLGSVSIVNGVSVSTASPFSCTPCKPSFVAVPGGNNALFTLDYANNLIYQFLIDQNTGKLRAQTPASVGAEGSPTWITIR